MEVYLVERNDGYALNLFKEKKTAEKWAKEKGDIFNTKYEVIKMTVHETV